VGSSWQACPLSSAWETAAVRADHRVLQCLDRAAAEWNRLVVRGRLGRLLRRGRSPAVHFRAEDYTAITATLGTPDLERTLAHIGTLRRQRRPRCSLHAIALLERVETAVATALDARRAAARGGRDQSGQVEGLWA